jgi:hypothetical protein
VLALGPMLLSQEKKVYMDQKQRETFFYGDETKAMNTSNSKLRPVSNTKKNTNNNGNASKINKLTALYQRDFLV